MWETEPGADILPVLTGPVLFEWGEPILTWYSASING